MPATFDGDALTITLPSSAGAGVLSVDVETDLYSDWKEWVLAGNAQYPQAFDTSAGDPLTTTLDAAGYFFLRNDLGWRIKPAEEDVNYYFTGNLIPRDSTELMLIPTTGAYTTAVFGLQDVSQTVTTENTDLTFLVKIVTNKREVVKNGDIWQLIVYDDDDTTPILQKDLKDYAGANITDLPSGVMAIEEANLV